jgi:hypothetical protein
MFGENLSLYFLLLLLPTNFKLEKKKKDQSQTITALMSTSRPPKGQENLKEPAD